MYGATLVLIVSMIMAAAAARHSRHLAQVVVQQPVPYAKGVFNGTVLPVPEGVLAGNDNRLVSCKFTSGGEL